MMAENETVHEDSFSPLFSLKKLSEKLPYPQWVDMGG